MIDTRLEIELENLKRLENILEKVYKDVEKVKDVDDFLDFLENQLGALEIRRIQTLLQGKWETLGYEILVCWGGPNVYIDTLNARIVGSWYDIWTYKNIPDELAEELNMRLDEVFSE